MNIYFKSLLYASLSTFLLSCAQPVTDPDNPDNDNNGNNNNLNTTLVEQVGADNTFEILTWNIENFPKPDKDHVDIPITVHNVKTIIRNLDVDLIAVQEIVNENVFNVLIDSLEGWNGFLNPFPDAYPNYQHTGLLYKSDMISVTAPTYILESHISDFAYRPPLAAYVKIYNKASDVIFNFHIIVLHLKAMSGADNEEKRSNSCIALKEYMDAEIAAGADPDFIVLGDMNDQITDPRTDNVFNVFLDDTAGYSFLTSEITDRNSYIPSSYASLIDHILISKDARQEYGAGYTDVLYLDAQFHPYPDEVSDHRPVVAVFKGFSIE